MDEGKFQEILNKFQLSGMYPQRFFTAEDLKSMRRDQLSLLTAEMTRFVCPGSYWLRSDLYDLVEYLDNVVSIPEDPNLEKYLHMVSSLVCLAWFETYDFYSTLPSELSKHLKRIIWFSPIDLPLLYSEPSLQIATFLAYPLLEGIVRRKLSQFITLQGRVVNEFSVKTKREKSRDDKEFRLGYQNKIDCEVKYHPDERNRINRLDDELRLLKQETKSNNFKSMLFRLEEKGVLDEVQDWRWQLLHGLLTASWHGLTLLLLIYVILLD